MAAPVLTFLAKICFSILVVVLIILIVIGNLIVMLAIIFDNSLKSQLQVWFLLSLALADFLVGLLIMPFSLVTELTPEWIFGPVWCELYRALDVLFVTASIWNLCLISLDRLWAVTRPIDYITKRTPKIILIMIIAVWSLAIIISIPPLMVDIGDAAISENVTDGCSGSTECPPGDISSEPTQDRNLGDRLLAKNELSREIKSPAVMSARPAELGESGNFSTKHRALIHCTIPDHPIYVIYSACGSFFVPVIIVLGVYVRIYFITRKRAHEQQIALKRINEQIDLGKQKCRGIGALTDRDFLVMINPENIPLLFLPTSSSHSAEGDSNHVAEEQKQALRERHKKLRQNEAKNNFMLGTVLFGFIGCWLPFFVVYILSGFGVSAHDMVFKVFFWLGYCNSALNPPLYTLFSTDFRRVFKKLFCIAPSRTVYSCN